MQVRARNFAWIRSTN